VPIVTAFHRTLPQVEQMLALPHAYWELAFTAGIGEHNAVLGERICAALGWLGLELDPKANGANASAISSARSRVLVAVEPTNEEWIAASHAVGLLASETSYAPQP
jgi:acetate kinase